MKTLHINRQEGSDRGTLEDADGVILAVITATTINFLDRVIAGTEGIAAVVDDLTPELGGDLDVNGYSIKSLANGDIQIAPHGSGNVVIDGINYPQTDGTVGQFILTDGAGQLSFSTAAVQIKTAYESNADTNNYDDASVSAVSTNTGKVTNATHTGDVTGSGALTLDPTALSNKPLVTAAGADHVVVVDATDGALKKALVSDFGVAGGGMAAATYDPTTVAGDTFAMDNMVEGTATKILSSAERTKLSGIEAGATTDQTGAQIKTAYQAEPNAFTDTKNTKLTGIETGATADQTGAQIKALYEVELNAFTDTLNTKLAGIETGATTDQTNSEIRTAVGAATDSNVYDDAAVTKLGGIEASATADQTGAQIKALYEGETSAFTDALFTKLGGIEASATTNQTGAEIKTAYQAELNAFTDALFTKLGGIETSATADQTGAQIKALYELEVSAFTDALFTKLGTIETSATADQTAAQIKTAYEGETNAFTDAQFTKLAGIEASATTDQTDAEIRAAVEAATDSNVFTDADHTKLNAVEALADVTDATNVAAAGAIMGNTVGLFADGTALLPSLSFTADTNTGMYRRAAETIGFSTAGADLFRMDASYLRGNVNYTPSMPGKAAGSVSAPAYSFVNDTNTGMYRDAADSLSFATGGVQRLGIDSGGIKGYVAFQSPGGSAAAPTHSFKDDTNTGMYRFSADRLGFTVGGAYKMLLNSTILFLGTVVQAASATAAAPAFSFTNDTNTGMYRYSADTLGFSTAGAWRMLVNASTFYVPSVYSSTTASSVNMYVHTNGRIYRSTSSVKYKKNVEPLEDEWANLVYEFDPVHYNSLCETDHQTYGHYGLIAEDVAKLDPRLVQFGNQANCNCPCMDGIDINRTPEEGEEPQVIPEAWEHEGDCYVPEGVAYDRLVPHLILLAKRYRDQITDLETRLQLLEKATP